MPTALLVDDDPQNLYLLRCVLGGDGFEFVEARNGREALDRAARQPVDLVISDILMPVMDGFSLCREWKSNAQWKSIPFVFYTATYVDKKDEELALSLGADLFMVKPADPVVLRERVTEIVKRHRQGQLASGKEPTPEAPFLQQYNAVLIHKLEEKLLELEKANQALRLKDLALSSSASGILLTAPSGEVSYANPAMARLSGRRESELVGCPVDGLFVPRERVASWVAGVPPAGAVELELAAPTGGPPFTWVQVTASVVNDDQGQRLGVMLSCLDISEEKRLRQELGRVQRLEALSLFAAGVAHDFNNLLMSMYGGLDLSEVPRTKDPDADVDTDPDESRAIALAAFERARELTRRLITFSKGSTSKRVSVNLPQILDESLSLALSGSPVRSERHYATPLPSAWADPGQLAQVLNNLLLNARQALNDQGTVVVSAGVGEAAGRLPPGRYLSIRVTDDGPGILPEVLPRIFEPYFTTKPEGSGLGLATSQAIVQEHGGLLSVSTQLGKGSTFEVLLPASPEAPSVDRGLTPDTTPVASRRILVMDDQVTIQGLLQRGLERVGHNVVVTSNGEQALLEFERARAQGRPFDLVVLDITVRGGMGGAEALSRLRQIDPRVVAVATTGYSDGASMEALRAQGFVHVLPKPFLTHELMGTIKAILYP